MNNNDIALTSEEKKKRKNRRNYIISVSLVLILTVGSLIYTLLSAGNWNIVEGANQIWNAIRGCNPWYLVLVLSLVIITYLIDGLIIYVFARLYTRRYHYYQGVCTSAIGAFYNNVSPANTGGQVMQVFTLKSQGIEVSNGASIMVMWFILYQATLILFGAVSIGVEWGTIWELQAIPGLNIGGWSGNGVLGVLIALGFALNVSLILLLLFMSYSHRFHNLILNHAISFLGRIHILKNPDKTRENLRVQVENFKIELKRLQSNIPVTILIVVLMFLMIFIRFSIPYFSGLALDAYGENYVFNFIDVFHFCFRSSFHQMVAGLFPIPGQAGISELIYNAMFMDQFKPTILNGVEIRSQQVNMNTSQLIWRVSTFHFVLIVGGMISAFYRSRPKEAYHYANRQTFVDLQLETFNERKKTIDTIYETKQLSRKEIEKRLKYLDEGQETGDDIYGKPLPKKKPAKKATKAPKASKTPKKE